MSIEPEDTGGLHAPDAKCTTSRVTSSALTQPFYQDWALALIASKPHCPEPTSPARQGTTGRLRVLIEHSRSEATFFTP